VQGRGCRGLWLCAGFMHLRCCRFGRVAFCMALRIKPTPGIICCCSALRSGLFTLTLLRLLSSAFFLTACKPLVVILCCYPCMRSLQEVYNLYGLKPY